MLVKEKHVYYPQNWRGKEFTMIYNFTFSFLILAVYENSLFFKDFHHFSCIVIKVIYNLEKNILNFVYNTCNVEKLKKKDGTYVKILHIHKLINTPHKKLRFYGTKGAIISIFL